MDGPAVFHFVLCKVNDFLSELLQRRGLSMADFDMVLLHQANKMMIDTLYRKLGVPAGKAILLYGGRGELLPGVRCLPCSRKPGGTG